MSRDHKKASEPQNAPLIKTLFISDISITPLQVHYYSEVLTTTALLLCRNLHAEALQATVSEGLAQDPYMAARVGCDPPDARHQIYH